MDYLLDTHALLWFINGEGLSDKIVSEIKNTDNNVFLKYCKYLGNRNKVQFGKVNNTNLF
ncbi:hypothetical protein RG47T_3980 [Mucilaginibacter polytrichastri]|uniref:PIN domain-containing protein n=1 Tax=Mucilaginibacter polytrichastri TaxID=1302689 RepID=A0A1Q6A3D9_9SPHI|nr:hypothetical protein RG47T_3980 [Mucilaginibacter polytrichastri]